MVERVGILTSGGDCPGLNPGIVAVAAALEHRGVVPIAVARGYQGLYELGGDGSPTDAAWDLSGLDASQWVREGGTMLSSRRFKLSRHSDGIDRALRGAERIGIDALVVFGGDGSLQGAATLNRSGLPTVGIPKTIDRDVAASEDTIGFLTAAETGCELTERVASTAHSHGLAFLVEVMGRRSGALAAAVARCAGADGLLVGEAPADYATLVERMNRPRGHRGLVVVMAEGYWPKGLEVPESCRDDRGRVTLGDAARCLERRLGDDGVAARSTRLGHALRGGRPCAADRLLADALGREAVRSLLAGRTGTMAVVQSGQVTSVDLDEADLPRRKLCAEELADLEDLLW